MNSWIVLLPPLFVIIAAFIIRNVLISLICGVISAALIITGGNVVAAVRIAFTRFSYEAFTADHLYTFAFLLVLGLIIQLMTHTGALTAYTNRIRASIHSARSAQVVSLLLSNMFFLDDYLNSLMVGSIMRPVTDAFGVPRAKLAFLVDSLSAPLCVIVPASSWVAMILVQMQVSGVTEDPFGIYIATIPFLFYPLLIIVSAYIITLCGLSFGPLARYETIARETGNLFGGKPPLIAHAPTAFESQKVGSLYDFIIPCVLFMIVLVAALLHSGQWQYMGGTASLVQAIQMANIFFALCLASIVTVFVMALTFLIQKKISSEKLLILSYYSWKLMKNSLLVLLCAWTLSSLLKNDLHAGEYVAHILIKKLSLSFVPCMFFIVALIVSASTGSAWGTIAVIMPLAIPVVYHLGFLIYPTLGALISGAVAGGHVSPITDSTVMASTSTECYHLDHVYSQLIYSIPAVMGSIGAFICAGLLDYSYYTTALISVSVGVLLTLIFLYVGNALGNRFTFRLRQDEREFAHAETTEKYAANYSNSFLHLLRHETSCLQAQRLVEEVLYLNRPRRYW